MVSQLGRPDDGTDVSGFYNIELFAPLKPNDEWRRGVTKEKMTIELSKQFAAAFPGVIFNFSQAISDNVEEAMSGVKGENTVKVVGPDLRVNEAKGAEIEDILGTVADRRVPRSASPTRAYPRLRQCGCHGLNRRRRGGGRRRPGGDAGLRRGEAFDLTAWAPARKHPQTIRNIPVATPDGARCRWRLARSSPRRARRWCTAKICAATRR